MRLQKYIAKAGVTSRRKAEELITKGKVKVNGEVLREMGIKIDPEKDIVLVDNKKIDIVENKLYVMLNKPEGYVTTMDDQFNRAKVTDLVEEIKDRIYPVGRLDYNTSGLLLLTNDGDLTNKITHPKNHIDKTYLARVKGILSESKLKRFEKGIDIGGYITAPAKIELIKKYEDSCDVKIIIHEGKNRQIRRMLEILDHPVTKLSRIAIGNLTLNGLPKGKWRNLNSKEIEELKTF